MIYCHVKNRSWQYFEEQFWLLIAICSAIFTVFNLMDWFIKLKHFPLKTLTVSNIRSNFFYIPLTSSNYSVKYFEIHVDKNLNLWSSENNSVKRAKFLEVQRVVEEVSSRKPIKEGRTSLELKGQEVMVQLRREWWAKCDCFHCTRVSIYSYFWKIISCENGDITQSTSLMYECIQSESIKSSSKWVRRGRK